jgi:hypothetical protein
LTIKEQETRLTLQEHDDDDDDDENRVLRMIFKPKREEVTGEWRIYVRSGLMICTH